MNLEEPSTESRPVLRLFLSVDIVGSTAAKDQTRQLGQTPEWLSAFQMFYSRMPTTFSEQQRALGHLPIGSEAMLWKAIGDELLFFKDIDDYQQALWVAYAWRRAVEEVRVAIRAMNSALDLKTTGWVAAFPTPNVEVALPGGSRDFLGPTVDLGFRLATRASPRDFVVSVELALMLVEALAAHTSGPSWGRWVFFYEGAVSLKGVAGGPYPVFVVDTRTGTEAEDTEDHLLGRVHADIRQIRVLTRAMVDENRARFFDPTEVLSG